MRNFYFFNFLYESLFRDFRNIVQIYKIVNKKLPHKFLQGSFYIFLTDLFFKKLRFFQISPF